MATEILGHTVGATANELAIHSMEVMDKFSNGEAYNETVWIERGRFAVRQTMEGMFELGRALIIIKEHTPHGRFFSRISAVFRRPLQFQTAFALFAPHQFEEIVVVLRGFEFVHQKFGGFQIVHRVQEFP